MKKIKNNSNINKFITLLFGATLLLAVVSPADSVAAQIQSRSIGLGTSAPGVSTTNTVTFTVQTTGNIGSIKFEYCTTAYTACVVPVGFNSTGATLTAQSGATGFSMVNAANGAPYITRVASNVNALQVVSYNMANIINPSAVNTEYWVRISTYASSDTSGLASDDGVVALHTTNEITLSGIMPESLIFCVGTSGTDCGNITGSAVSFGVFSPLVTSTGTSVMSASTNAAYGYAITLSGTTLTSGANSISPMGTQSQDSTACTPSCTSATSVGQFGTNVRANTTPLLGADVSGSGGATGVNGYNSVNNYRFYNGDKVAGSAGVSKANLFTNSYIVNVGGDQPAGVYTATLTYICTATF